MARSKLLLATGDLYAEVPANSLWVVSQGRAITLVHPSGVVNVQPEPFPFAIAPRARTPNLCTWEGIVIGSTKNLDPTPDPGVSWEVESVEPYEP